MRMSDCVDEGLIRGQNVVLGITGSIAAYKALEVIRLLRACGALVHPVMTEAAQKLLSPICVATLAGNSVALDLFSGSDKGPQHIRLASLADAVLIAPTTANLLGKLATGIADDLLSALVMACRKPIFLAPAMNEHMWLSPAVQRNVAFLKTAGFTFLGPDSGPLACGRSGIGRMQPADAIVRGVEQFLCSGTDFAGKRFLVTAGPTREYLDGVRFLSNPSSGKMGYALAEELHRRGAKVLLISGPTSLPAPPNVALHKVTSAHEMHQAVRTGFPASDGLFMAAAVADYRPETKQEGKLKKGGCASFSLGLERTIDILQDVAQAKGRRLLVGFCAETEHLIERAIEKRRDKGLDLIIGNDISAPGSGFVADTNKVVLIDRSGQITRLPLLTKREVAREICDAVRGLLRPQAHEQ